MQTAIGYPLSSAVRIAARWAMCGVILAILPVAARADVTIGAGTAIDFADARIDLGCGNLSIAGAAAATSASVGGMADFNLAGGSAALGASTFELGGSFSNAGSFAPGTSTVNLSDDCGAAVSRFSGATNFYALSIVSAAGKQVSFPVGLVQSVAFSLTLQGSAGQLLGIASSAAGQRGVLALANGAQQNIAYVSARDNLASIATIAPGAAANYHSVDGGNLVNWFANGANTGGGSIAAAVPAPALGAGRWGLIAALLMLSLRALRTQAQGMRKNSSRSHR
jgi:hypothetical protein